jgi:LDH2 family malate/lactate/ureidoglycolate dehydrogenase
MAKKYTKIDVASLKRLAVDAFCRAGLSAADAATAAHILVEADMMGTATHGVLRLQSYTDRLRSAGINGNPRIVVDKRAPSLALVDGDNGLGPVVGGKALNVAIEMVRETGMAYVGCRNSNHFGALAPYAIQACDAGFVFMGGTNASTTICPWGGREARLGNNPFSIAAPCRDGFHFILDMAMSVAARGKIRAARDNGEPIPAGWAMDKNGLPTTNPLEALSGFLLPMGGYKGSGLSMAVDILAGVLTGGQFLNTISSWVDNPDAPSRVGHFFVLIDPDRLIGRENFALAMDRFRRIVLDTPPAVESTPVVLPGQIEQTRRQKALAEGIEIPSDLLASIRLLAAG